MTEKLFPDFAEHIDPALVSPAVAYLASRECAVTAETWSVIAGRVARVFVGVTPGYFDRGLTREGSPPTSNRFGPRSVTQSRRASSTRSGPS